MVSKETSPCLARSSEGSQEKAMTVRSVLLNRDSPDIETRLKRRRSRTQQVRFKDLVGPPPEPAATADTNTPCASTPPRDSPELVANCASDAQRSWHQAKPRSLTLPMPSKVCLSTAIQTSPSLQQQFPASRVRSKSTCDFDAAAAWEPSKSQTGCRGPPRAPTSARASRDLPQCTLTSLSAHNHLPASPLAQHTSREGQPGPTPHATLCHGLTPPPRAPCPPYPGTSRCTAANYTSQQKGWPPAPSPSLCSSQPPAYIRNCGSPKDSHSAPAPCPLRPPSVPCGQPGPSAEPRPRSRSQSEQDLPSQPAHSRMAGSHGLGQPAQCPSQRDPTAALQQGHSSSWGSPSCLPSNHSPSAVLPPPSLPSSAATLLKKTPATLSHQAPSSGQAQSVAARPSVCSRLKAIQTECGLMNLEEPQQLTSTSSQGHPPRTQPFTRTPGAPWSNEPLGEPCLTAEQLETLHQVQDLLQLVAAAKGQVGLSKADEHFLTSRGHVGVGPGQMGDLQSQLQSLEGVLETSQQTITVLLDVIQDLEKKEAQRDGRHSYRTGQDIANCGTCRDCACIIYSVEHDFRQQEGRFQRVLSSIESESRQSSPTTAPATTPTRQELSPMPKLPAKLDSKKSRRKCFWFL
ncbi:activating signal cointegrator 1 [Platysternon megacephalum]|uniref:Activating signal cointegrator 1 n=1 Tax=Platysternon megacephalum TaxID=55544 RepID=A0A4D9DT64_9SAUR|nr:activating signal cointegrator 1 [Platysternon megacephalum]